MNSSSRLAPKLQPAALFPALLPITSFRTWGRKPTSGCSVMGLTRFNHSSGRQRVKGRPFAGSRGWSANG
jgi:hypothetical protein